MKAGEVLTPQVDQSMDAPKCEKCGDEIMGGASIWCCRYARECPMWPHSDGTAESDAAELLMAKLWMGNALEQIGIQIEDRKRLEAELEAASIRFSEEKILRERAQGGLRMIRAMATLDKAQRNGVSAPDLRTICDAGLSPERTILYSQVSDPKDFTPEAAK